ncbi:glycosyltransferase [Agromyces tardus]|uniref:Glycosyltransferase n=1 Tax=Agromyces tardus TaxID=2583849 RepID=A0A3M8A6M0_9MICO|nr:nucleotide disphospho-sugar-binding domain-containing protein [Agromyces tardus]RNB46722.1 glycosyltransferase [Agromyces tardus]
MSTFAVVTAAAGGNMPPALAIGSALARRGNELHVLGQERQRAAVESAGLAFTPLASLEFYDSRVRRSVPDAIAQAARLAADRELEREVADHVRVLGADAALVDCLLASSLRGARRAGVPAAVLFHTFLEFWERSYRRGPVGILARMRGVDPLAEWNAAEGRIVASLRTLDPAGSREGEGERPAASWVGAIEHGVAAAPDAGRPPLVMVSLSTTWFPGQTEAYQRIVTALGSLPVRGVVTLGGLTPDRELVVPPNVEVLDFASHDELLPRASLVIGHGGHSTTFRALAHGLPVIAVPMHPMLDQPMVADAIAGAGVGVHLHRRSSSDRFAAAVTALLADDELRGRAARFGAELRATDAAATAADALERVAARRPHAAA